MRVWVWGVRGLSGHLPGGVCDFGEGWGEKAREGVILYGLTYE